MEIITLEELLESLKESLETELLSQGLATWTIGAAGNDFSEALGGYSIEDLEQLREEILEGNKIEVTIDLSDAIVAHLDDLIEEAEKQAADEEEDEDEDFDSEEDDADEGYED